MDITGDIAKAKDLITKAHEVLVVTHESPTFDSIGSSLAIYLGLLSLGKKVSIACPEAITVELSNFVGVNKIISHAGKKNFIISLDYVEGSIEKVSYNIEGEKFNLVIEPRPGFDPFSEDKVHFSHTGVAADLICVVDTIHLGGLKNLYEEDKELFATKPVINIDRHPNNTHFGAVNLVDAQAAASVEVVAQLLSASGVRVTEDIATNMINALFQATNNFQHPAVSGKTFELAALCLRAGARRFGKPFADDRPRPAAPVSDPAAPPVSPQVSPSVRSPLPKPDTQVPVNQVPNAAPGQAPADWLKPKIFKSSNLA